MTGRTEVYRSILTNRFIALLLVAYVGSLEKELTWKETFLFVGPVCSEIVVLFSSGIPTGL